MVLEDRRPGMQETEASLLARFVGRCVVLDTQGSLVYIGRLEACDERGYWLTRADVHDRNEGHSTKEEYINDACALEREGARTVNRRRVFVERGAVVSISALEDVLVNGESDDADGNQP